MTLKQSVCAPILRPWTVGWMQGGKTAAGVVLGDLGQMVGRRMATSLFIYTRL